MEDKQQYYNNNDKGLTLSDIFFIIKKNLLIILLITGLCTLGGAVYGSIFKKYTVTATATAVVMVDTSTASTTQSDMQNFQQAVYMINTYKELIKSNMVAKAVSESEVGQKYKIEVASLSKNVTVTTTTNSLIVTITYKCSADEANDYSQAIEVCNQILDSTIALVNSKEDDEYVYDKLANCFRKVDAATEATTTASRGALKLTAICFAVGLVLSFAVCLIRYFADDTYTSKEEFEKTFNINVLTLIPDLTEKYVKTKGGKQ